MFNVDAVYGIYPKDPCIVVSADDKYVMQHGPSFVYSAAKHGHNVHINVINPTKEVCTLLLSLQKDIKTKLTYTFMHFRALQAVEWDNVRAFFASSRFIIAMLLLQEGLPSCLISDIDSVVVQPIPTPDTVIGIYTRPEESDPRMKVAAGIMYVEGADGLQFLQHLIEKITEIGFVWFVDQVAIKETMDQKKWPWMPLDRKYMDWAFETKDCYIWTGKGDRKHNNQTYIEFKNSENKLSTLHERVWNV